MAPSKASPPHRPETIIHRERKRQKTLAAKADQAPPPSPKETRTRTALCLLKGFTSWTDCPVPLNLVLVREHYGDGHQDLWALMTTADATNPAQPKADYGLRATIEERHRLLKCFYDLSDFHSRSLNVITAQVVFILLSYTLRQWQLWRLRQEAELAGKTRQLLQRRLDLHRQYVVIYHQHAYAQLPLVTFTREVLELAPEARAKALAQIRKLEQSFLTPLENLRAPP